MPGGAENCQLFFPSAFFPQIQNFLRNAMEIAANAKKKSYSKKRGKCERF